MAVLHTLLVVKLFVLLLVVGIRAGSCPASTLPSAPVYPASSDVLAASFTPSVSSSNPLTTGHWSEKAKLSDYRPPAATIESNPAQTNCPHKQSNLKNWQDASTWPSGSVPANGADVTIPANTEVLISSCSVSSTAVFGLINVPFGSSLVFDDATISIAANGFNVSGAIKAGSDTCRLRNKITITLHGKRGEKDATLPWVKGISVTGSIDVHGVQYFPTWTRLAMTAKPNDTIIFVQDIVNWQPGQRIVITTTELKDARDWHRNEERTIVSVKRTTLHSSVSAIQLDSALSFQHFGGREYQAEVSLLSRNIVIQGDAINSLPTDTNNTICYDVKTPASSYPCQNSWLTGFGGHVMIHQSAAQGRFSGVELQRVGQTNVLGRYPLHFHLIGNVTTQNFANHYVRDSAVHDSYFRCYAIHGTSGVKFTQNTAYNVIGHCYFLEDGVEENNEISYNQAAHIHPLGPFQNPSNQEIANEDNFYGQRLEYYTEGPGLLLPSDMSAGCFYITNTYNDIFGNAASGGWAGFAIPSLPAPVKFFSSVTDMVPANRPFLQPFRGNSAHSSGYWWQSAGSLYVGGELTHRSDGVLQYTAGRSTSRDTCRDKTAGSKAPGASGGCYNLADQVWLNFTDNKVFLSNRGMQNWGNRANIVNLELHDVSLAMNIFGKVWIDNLLMECRTSTNRFTFFNGCSKAPKEGSTEWGACNVRDYTFFRSFSGFQWYDVGQQHILTSSTFRNCRADWERCSNGGSRTCSNVAVFTSLTHSDQFVPDQMQATSGLKYENVSDLWRYSTSLSAPTGVTVSGRLQNWLDADGSASLLGVKTQIGSARANQWWKTNDQCQYYIDAYRCPMQPGDSTASVVLKTSTYASDESKIGNGLCANGHSGGVLCPVLAKVSHFGSKNETAGLDLAVNAKLTGPLIAASGGWFIRYANGTPKTLTFTSVQVAMLDNLVLAIPYPSDTKFTIYHKGASWCNPSWGICRKDYISVSSLKAVRSAFGDAYFWSQSTQTLYLKLVQSPDSFGSPNDKSYNNSAPWKPREPTSQFKRGGLTLIQSSSATSIVIEATCSSDPCTPLPNVPIPAAFPLVDVPTSAPVPTSTPSTSSPSTSSPSTSKPATSSPSTSSPSTSKPSTTSPSPSTTSKPATTTSKSTGTANVDEPTNIMSGSATVIPSVLLLVAAFVGLFM